MRILYRNGRIRSAAGPGATALLVEGADIAWIGADPGADAPSAAQTVDLRGALVTPAFVDAHVHLTATGLTLTGLDLSNVRSPAELLERVARVAQSSRGRPIIGGGWDDTDWAGQLPTRAQLDRAAYGGAVYLARVDVHSALVSSALVAAVGGVAGMAGYAADGALTRDAHDAVRRAALAGLTRSQRTAAQRAALQHAASLGIACVHEMAGPAISGEQDLTDALTLGRVGDLPEVIGYWGELLGVDAAIELGAVGAGGDLFCDGSLGSHTAALTSGYADLPHSGGVLRFDTGELVEHLTLCADREIRAGFHAIGDAAVDQILDAVEALDKAGAGRAAAPVVRIEHAEMINDVARFARSGAIASMQPLFDATWGGPAGMYARRLGTERAAGLNDLGALATAQVPLALGSDAPVTPMSPWAAIRAAAYPHRAASAIDAATAFRAHTEGGWAAAGRPDEGRLKVGAPATFAVWDVAEYEAALPDLRTALPGCLRTVRAGTTIFDADR